MKTARQRSLFDEFIEEGKPASSLLPIRDERELVALAVELGAGRVSNWSTEESRLCKGLPSPPPGLAELATNLILQGKDPLGDTFCSLRTPLMRRSSGATFTPHQIVRSMLAPLAGDSIQRIVDPGLGSGRFALHAGRMFPDAAIFGIEIDPLPAVLARANLAVAGMADRAQIKLIDFRHVTIPAIRGRTAFIGNPPYVRHHLIDSTSKQWLIEKAASLGLPASQLAGLHVYFFLATALKASPGDLGIFITAAEWLEVNYGKLVRDLFLGKLGGKEIAVVEPSARPFPDADTTAAIVSFEIGTTPAKVRMKRATTIGDLTASNPGRLIRRERLETENRWSRLTRSATKPPRGYIELGEICRVHRGQVTGANKIWIEGPHSEGLPNSVLFPSVTKARELFRVGTVLSDASPLRRVIDLPVNLDCFDKIERKAIDRFLSIAKSLGIDRMYVASNRRAWWSVGLRTPAPVLATYMARRSPAFVLNLAGARHINIAHGLYPREKLSNAILAKLVESLSNSTRVTDGRTYAGGLTKFEPREMERLFVPSPELLAHEVTNDRSSSLDAG